MPEPLDDGFEPGSVEGSVPGPDCDHGPDGWWLLGSLLVGGAARIAADEVGVGACGRTTPLAYMFG
jgi:hypothetical protein